MIRPWRSTPAWLSRAVAVRYAYFTMDVVLALGHAQPENNDHEAMRVTSKRTDILLCRGWR